MRNIISLGILALCAFFTSCGSPKGNLLDSALWQTQGGVSFDNGVMTLSENSSAILKKGDYVNFRIDMTLRTVGNGKGYIAFHTDTSVEKGYKVALNNDLGDTEWWKMTGSLLSVRNLTKSFVRDGDWFDMMVCVQGREVLVFINDRCVVDYFEPENPYRKVPNLGAVLSSGSFAVAGTDGGAIEIRSMSLIPIDLGFKREESSQLANAVDEQTDEIIRLHQEDFPVLDYHVHLKGGLTKEEATLQSRRTGINYTIAPNCGIGFPITTDEQIYGYLDTMRTQPFILAMQAEGREWLTTFSQKARDEFDFVFTDALTFTDDKGRRTRLWIEEETWIEDEQKYMDMIVDRIIAVLQEPVDVYVNPCYLPDTMSDRYDEFWTEARMNRFVDALARSGKALEINELYNIPNKAIIMKAKERGVKFTFGTNNVVPEVSMLQYGIRMKKECGLTAGDMYRPKIKIN